MSIFAVWAHQPEGNIVIMHSVHFSDCTALSFKFQTFKRLLSCWSASGLDVHEIRLRQYSRAPCRIPTNHRPIAPLPLHISRPASPFCSILEHSYIIQLLSEYDSKSHLAHVPRFAEARTASSLFHIFYFQAFNSHLHSKTCILFLPVLGFLYVYFLFSI